MVGIKSHPALDVNGVEWDADGGPDKFVKIFNNETNNLLYTTSVQEYTPVTWLVEPILSVNFENTTLRFELYDEDVDEDVLMDVVELELKSLTGTTASTSNDLYPILGELQGDNFTTFTIAMTWTE